MTTQANAVCESFLKTLKQEEIYYHQYADLHELTDHVGEFLETYYNRQRLHSALGYRTPLEFEQAHRSPSDREAEGDHRAAKMSFPRHQEIYQSDVVD